MKAEIQSATMIARPVEDVFQFLLDLDRHPTDPGIAAVVKSPSGPTAPGTTFRFRHDNGRETTMRFTAVEPSRRIGFESIVGPLRPVGELALEGADGRTRLSVRVTPNPVGAFKLLDTAGPPQGPARLGRTARPPQDGARGRQRSAGGVSPAAGMTTEAGSPGLPPPLLRYRGTPTQVNSSPASGSRSSPSILESRNVIPEAPMPSA